jgi:hypothetical protein
MLIYYNKIDDLSEAEMNKTHLCLSLILSNDVYLIVKLLPLSRYNISLSIYNIGLAVLNAH